MATLKIVSGANAGQSFRVDGAETIVGRDEFCGVVLPAQTVSRQHARILSGDAGFFIEDMQSVNGTLVNGRRVEGRTPLSDQDRIRIHDIVLTFHVGPQEVFTNGDDGETVSLDPREAERIVSALDARSSPEVELEVNAQRKLRAILEITQNLGSSLDLDEVLPRILDGLFHIFAQADRGYVLQASGPDGELVPSAIKHRDEKADTISPIGGSVSSRVMSEGTAFLSGDAASDSRLEEMSQSVFEEEIRSVMCAPLMGHKREPLGVIHIETRDPRQPFTPLDLEVLVSVATLAGQAVEYARLHEAILDVDRQKRELAMAKDVQLHFLPSRRPEVAGYRFFHYYRAADVVAGDYFDYVELPDGRLAMAVGDVAGKGVSAALLMARLCSEVRYTLLTSESAAAAVSRLNQQLSGQLVGGRFVTFVLCILDPQSHQLTVVNAGHTPPLLRRGATRELVSVAEPQVGLPLGVERRTEYVEETIGLEPGDVVLCYTDGVNEAMNPTDELYGSATLRELVAGGADDVVHLGQAIVADVRRFAQGRLQSDDMCVLAVGRTEGAPEGGGS